MSWLTVRSPPTDLYRIPSESYQTSAARAFTAMKATIMNSNERLDTLDSMLQQRHSCRGFLPNPVPRERIERILDVAQRTASWCNAQPWQVHIVGGPRLHALRGDLVARAETGAKPSS
ncbi:hypothetical protein BH09PSE5_BH09PSE5_23340 [soil metagenome]